MSDLDIKKKIIDKIPAKHRDFFLRERPIEMRHLPGESMFDEPLRIFRGHLVIKIFLSLQL